MTQILLSTQFSDSPANISLSNDSLGSVLKSQFGFSSFRPHQEEVCRNVAQGRDVLVVMPTGAGKSLCYQLPGLVLGSTTLVISPLLALIEDQVEKLKLLKVQADRIHSGRKREDLRQACFDYLDGKLQFLFIAPERLSVPGFVEMLKKRPPSLIAVDEAHCISQWGHDFRPDYRLLGERIHDFRPAPVIALTATATPIVQNDICKQLSLLNEIRSIHGFRRHNIAIQVVELSPSDRPRIIQSFLKGENRLPAIVYAPTRKVAEQLFQALESQFKVGIYHAGMLPMEREKNQALFLSGKLDLIVATVAFGMGIDKANIRVVIHAALPGSVEGYYQEIGRAGRDGGPSQAILLSSFADQRTHDFFFERDYPEVSFLKRIFKKLTGVKVPKDLLRESLRPMEDEIFEKALEKLWIHRGAGIDFEENVSVGQHTWEKTYLEQREYKKRQTLQMIEFARGTQCRMLSLVKYFGDLNDSGLPCGKCDFCAPSQIEGFSSLRSLMSNERSLIKQILSILSHQPGLAAGRIYQELCETQPDLPRQDVEKLFRLLALVRWIDIAQNSFVKDGQSISYRKISLSAVGNKVTSKEIEKLQIFEVQKVSKVRSGQASQRAKVKHTSSEALNPLTFSPLFEKIRAWRVVEAKKKGVPAFRILSDRIILALCEAQPKSQAALLKVKGVGPKLSRFYGTEILKLIQKMS